MTEERCHTVVEANGRAVLWEAVRTGRNHAWRFYRDPRTGAEWKENGPREWESTPEAALRSFVRSRWPYTAEAALVRALTGDDDEEEDFRLVVDACRQLWRLWHPPAAGTRPRPGGTIGDVMLDARTPGPRYGNSHNAPGDRGDGRGGRCPGG